MPDQSNDLWNVFWFASKSDFLTRRCVGVWVRIGNLCTPISHFDVKSFAYLSDSANTSYASRQESSSRSNCKCVKCEKSSIKELRNDLTDKSVCECLLMVHGGEILSAALWKVLINLHNTTPDPDIISGAFVRSSTRVLNKLQITGQKAGFKNWDDKVGRSPLHFSRFIIGSIVKGSPTESLIHTMEPAR